MVDAISRLATTAQLDSTCLHRSSGSLVFCLAMLLPNATSTWTQHPCSSWLTRDTTLILSPLSHIINFSPSAGSLPSAYKHAIIFLFLKTKKLIVSQLYLNLKINKKLKYKKALTPRFSLSYHSPPLNFSFTTKFSKVPHISFFSPPIFSWGLRLKFSPLTLHPTSPCQRYQGLSWHPWSSKTDSSQSWTYKTH